MIECIKYRDEEHVAGLARVVEFHVSGNELTVQSLPKLGEVVALSKGDLHELDVSNNSIKVETPEQKQMWFDFLSSFKDCYMLKKLDLGANPLGHAGMEILAQVYIKSELDFLEAEAEDILENAASEIEVLAKNMAGLKMKPAKENESSKVSGQKKSPNKGKNAKASGESCLDGVNNGCHVDTDDLQVTPRSLCPRKKSKPSLSTSHAPEASGPSHT